MEIKDVRVPLLEEDGPPKKSIREGDRDGDGQSMPHEDSGSLDYLQDGQGSSSGGNHSRPSGSSSGLRKRLTLIDGISITVGVVVGSGVFASPGVALEGIQAVGPFLLLWALGGFLTLASSLCYAELGSAIPNAGGDVEYLRRAFGPCVAFAFTWSNFFVISGGGIAIVAITFARYTATIPYDIMGIDEEPTDSDAIVKAIAIGTVAILTAINCMGVSVGAGLERVVCACKTLLVATVIAAAAVAFKRDPSVARSNFSRLFEGTRVAEIGPSLVAIIWAFDGWSSLSYMSEEMVDPGRDLPHGISCGMAIVSTIYLLMNAAYLLALPASSVASSPVVAVQAAERGLGSAGGTAVAVLVAVTVLGCANGSIMIGGRYLFSASREGLFPRVFGHLSQRARTPHSALIIQGLWICAILLLPISNLEHLLSYFGVAAWIFYGTSAAALIRLRRSCPDLPRPFRVPLFPATPLLLIAVALYMVVSSILVNTLLSVIALAFVGLSVPAYAMRHIILTHG